jgi:O-antigen biosynthesis protein
VRSVLIGLYIEGGLERLDASLAALKANTSGAHELVLLPDGLDDLTRTRLTSYGIASLSDSQEAAGAPTCFNRLAAQSDADVIVFLEAGSVPGPGWLEALLGALNADRRNGLAGPSTNLAWNEQCLFVGASGSLAEVARTAETARLRFGNKWRTLEPLHSLADFCRAVRREVVEAIGGADENYGLGPCWEMDYNIRAARAGFRGVWACSSYVWRPAFSARRQHDEPRRFEASKRRYQDKFCALRRRRERHDYEPHCRGDACQHFAVQPLIQLHLEPPGGHTLSPTPSASPVAHPKSDNSLPLVSCVMATQGRWDYVQQSVRYFERQGYPNRELVIVADITDGLDSGAIPSSDRVRYERVRPGMSIGAKRNRGCELARGTIIAQWDDDDWYSPTRLSVQVAPLIAREAEISALRDQLFLDLPSWRFWSCRPELHRRMFVEDVLGGTLVYLRSCWGSLARYPDCSLAEDAALLQQAMRYGARLKSIAQAGLFVYLRHRTNSWKFECGAFIDPKGWMRAPEPAFLADDRAFYAARSAAAPLPAGAAARAMVTCVMPTSDRRRFVPHAIQYFLHQTYPNRELLILDDGADSVSDLVPHTDQIRYVRLEHRHSLGAKRNLGCELARGEIIAHWDDDDWSADWRLAYQVAALAKHPVPAVCGVSQVLFADARTGRAWTYHQPAVHRAWLSGGTLCYHKALWRRFPFKELTEGEDTEFIRAVPESSVVRLTNNRCYVATVHAGNTSPKRTTDLGWRPVSATQIRAVVGADWHSYQAASRA